MSRIFLPLFVICFLLTSFFPPPGSVYSAEGRIPDKPADNVVSEIGSFTNATTIPLTFSTYLGGSVEDTIRDVTTDSLGYIYVAGGTASPDFPVTTGSFDTSHNGLMDAFVAKLAPSGVLIWATYIGGPNYDRAYAIEVDALGYVYVAGRAGQGLPTTPGVLQRTFAGDVTPSSLYGQQDGFIAKISPDGAHLVWSTYFGSDGKDFVRDLALDPSGNIYIAVGDVTRPHPHITSGAFQTTLRGPSDGIVAKISANGSSVMYASYFGGSSDEGGTPSIRVNDSGNAYFLIMTSSTDAPVTANAYKRTFSGATDLLLAKFSADGSSVVFSTYFGGTSGEGTETHNLAIDGSGNAYIAFSTRSTSLPTTTGAFQSVYGGSGGSGTGANTNYTGDVFVAKITGDGSRLLAGTYLGGRYGEGAEGVGVDAQGNVYVSGATYSDNFPVSSGPFQSSNRGQADFFVAKLTGGLTQLTYSTFVGGSVLDYGRTSTVDSNGNFYVAGMTKSQNWPLSHPIQSSLSGNWDGALAKFGQTGCQAAISPTSQTFQAAGGTGSVNVTEQAGCGWTAVSNAGWINVTSGGGTGDGAVTYSVAANSSTNYRTGTITIASLTFTITQAGATSSCSFSISPTRASFPTSGGTGKITVTADSNCSWTALTTVSWISITSGSSGVGNGIVNYKVEANNNNSPRKTLIQVAGQTFAVYQ